MSANWTVDATTSASGALAVGGTITVSAPDSTTFPSASSAYKVNGITVTAIPTTAAGRVTIATPAAIAASSVFSVVITGVDNPAAGTYAGASFSVSTGTDSTASSPASGLSFGSVVSGVSFSPSSTVGAATATWTVGFTTSASGALGTGDTITISAPGSTTFPSLASAYKVNGITVTAIPTTAAGTVTIVTPVALGDSALVSVQMTGVINPAAASYPNTSSSVSSTADAAANPGSGQSFSVGQVTTTTGLGLSSSSVAYDSETSEIFTITVTGLSGDGYPEGTVVVYNSSTRLCSATLAPISAYGASATCSLTAHELSGGSYSNVFATYSPGTPSSSAVGFTYGTSSSTPAQAFSVASVNTTTGLGLSLASVAYGSETSETFTVTVTGQTGDGHPEGTVAVYNSATKLCSATLNPIGGHSASATCSLAAYELAGGAYSDVFATYSPGIPSSSNASFTYGTSSSTPLQSFSVGSVNTTTGLVLSSSSVAYDSETSEIFTITVTGLSGDGYPEGTVVVYNSTTKLCSATLAPVSSYSASAMCSLTAHELPGGLYSQVFAAYSPGTPSSSAAGFTYGTSSSTPVQAFSVASVSTTTGLGLSLASVAYGSETSEIFTATVTGQTGDGHPEGTVAVYNSAMKLCSTNLNPIGGHSASATCSLAAYELAGGLYSQVFATYSPGIPSSSNASFTYGTSSSTPVQSFSVGQVTSPETTSTSLELSARRVTYGDEQVEQLSVSVSPQHPGTTPTGVVMISGANCQITLSAGKGSCTLSPTHFNAGNRSMVATYLGSSDFKRSASEKKTITIDTATTTTSLELSAGQVSYRDEQVEQLSVTVFPQYPGTTPTGTVTVSGANCQIRLSSGKGSCTLPAHYFRTGHHLMDATYNGSRNFRRSVSATQTIAVVR